VWRLKKKKWRNRERGEEKIDKETLSVKVEKKKWRNRERGEEKIDKETLSVKV
jgi:hypothetical protein